MQVTSVRLKELKSGKVVKEADNLQMEQINHEMGNSGLESSP